VGLAFVSSLVPAQVVAQDWIFQPTFGLGVDYNDNVRLGSRTQAIEGQDDKVAGIELDAGARITRLSPTGSVTLLPFIRSSHYGSDTDASSDDYYLDTIFQHRQERSQWSLTARFADEEVLSAELDDRDFDDPDIDQPVTDDSGLVIFENRRTRFAFSPGVSINASERTTLGFAGRFTDVAYENSGTSLTDFKDARIEASVRRSLDEQNALTVKIFGTNYDPDIEGLETDTYGLTAELSRRFSQRYSGFVSAGYQYADTTSLGGATTNNEGALLFALGLSRRFLVSNLAVEVRRSVDPSGIASLLERDQFRVRLSRELSELTTASISARYQQTNGLTVDSPTANRDFGRVELRLNRQLSRAWAITAAYSYTTQEFADERSSESANEFNLGIRYLRPTRE
jgi:hypothetical protein